MKQHAPAALRNREPIAEILARELPASGTVLEIASGTGEHAAFFAEAFPALEWQPSDPSAEAIASIAAYREDHAGRNLAAPLLLDAADPDSWAVTNAAAILCINMVHISPWASALGLLDGAARLNAPLILYGPWLVDGEDTAPSNLAFDEDLNRRNPAWGLRLVSDFAQEAAKRGLKLCESRVMPANNRMLLLT